MGRELRIGGGPGLLQLPVSRRFVLVGVVVTSFCLTSGKHSTIPTETSVKFPQLLSGPNALAVLKTLLAFWPNRLFTLVHVCGENLVMGWNASI